MTQDHENQARGFLLEQRVTWTDLERRRRNRQAIAELQRQLHEATDPDEIELILSRLESLRSDCEDWIII